MTIRLTLLAPPLGTPAHTVRIGDDRPLDERDRRAVRAIADGLPPADRRLSGPAVRCRQTAAVLGPDPVAEPALRGPDLGRWHGRTLDALAAEDPAALAAWTTDPDAAPHGGESVSALCRRVGAWLAGLPEDTGRVLAVADPAVARAAVVHVLSAPAGAFWRIDVLPLSTVRLTGRGGRWNVRMG
ncbi:histidine phosphatase family protein [Streptomyces sp. NPDC003077]|uniref:histidine phosphatase family protein n=1 Tax=Streptomyces sp. NPDC003077 TaxID=3154443 RepID=UPI00339DCC22